MNILLIAQCSKNALIESRRILDQFAERRGDRTWQTAITQQGLDTLRRLLRQTARKNTAVALPLDTVRITANSCGLSETRASSTNAEQYPPTRRIAISCAARRNDRHSAETIRLLASIAALFHDFGKACAAFQAKLQPGKSKKPLADAYRHEWISLRLFAAFVASESDESWLARLAQLPETPVKIA